MTYSFSLDRSGKFFSTFQRYISCTSRSPHHHQGIPSTLRSASLSQQCNQLPNLRWTSTSTKPQSSHFYPETHYSLFPLTLPRGPPPTGPFDIDPLALRKEFLQLQSLAHPDRHTGASKARAEGTSAHINNAYRTLLSPLRRAEYVLSLHNIRVAEDETAKTEDQGLIMEVLEVREEIENASTEEEVKILKSQNATRVKDCEKNLGTLLEKGDWENGKKECGRLRYWMGIEEALDNWEPGKPVVLVH